MSVKIRLSRHGKKGFAFFHILVTDSRAPRDSRFIELLGSYNPNSNPATIVLDGERALYWLNQGAQPSTTCRRILSYKGVLLKKHLQEGVAKKALTQEQADAKFNAWVSEKDVKVAEKVESIKSGKQTSEKNAAAAENKVNVARAEALAKKKAEADAAKAKAEAEKAEAEKKAAEEAKAAAEKSAEAAPKAEEPKAEEPKEAPKAEAPKTEETK
ncbi:MAG TPA: 30S ribosomal protein S16 [Candidatus Egerieousia sp.]|nr:30S ribosomal protein S16 [Candidatus Egerieousia sp.]HPT06171.1 30S ribosomal protein S16 [Candidatus Egerieousia sp.]